MTRRFYTCVYMYVCIIYSANDVTFCQTLLESLKYNVIIYEFMMLAHYLTIYSLSKFYYRNFFFFKLKFLNKILKCNDRFDYFVIMQFL